MIVRVAETSNGLVRGWRCIGGTVFERGGGGSFVRFVLFHSRVKVELIFDGHRSLRFVRLDRCRCGYIDLNDERPLVDLRRKWTWDRWREARGHVGLVHREVDR